MDEAHIKLEALTFALAEELDLRWSITNGSSSSSSSFAATAAAASDTKPEEDEKKQNKDINNKKKRKKEEKEEKKKMTMRVKNPRIVLPRTAVDERPPPMPEPMRRKIQELIGNNNNNNNNNNSSNGNIDEGPTWLQSKRLYESDITRQQNRLFLPNKDKLNELLSNGERENLVVYAKAKREGRMRSGVVDCNGRFWPLDLKIWFSLHKYVLMNQWMSFVKGLDLRAGDLAQIWCFREANGLLCFAINIVPGAREDDNKNEEYDNDSGRSGSGERGGEAADGACGSRSSKRRREKRVMAKEEVEKNR